MEERGWGDLTNWDEDAYRARLRADMVASTRTVFAARFCPVSSSSASPEIVATASSDGSVCLYPLSSCLQTPQTMKSDHDKLAQVAEPVLSLQKHAGPAYDLQFYGTGDNALLLSCGDDGRIQGWQWQRLKDEVFRACHVKLLEPDLVMSNPQKKGPRGALAPMPETNALAINSQEGCIYSAAGDGLAYCWDVETTKIKMFFKGHSDYVHCICARPTQQQVITGSEDGTVRIWDCRIACCVAILDPWKGKQVWKGPKERSPWVSCLALGASENWLVSGTGGHSVTLWNLPGLDAVTRIATLSAPQALTIANDQIITVGAQPHLSCFSYGGDMISQVGIAPLSAFSVCAHPSGVRMVGGYGGLVDIISEFGSHICTFQCK